MNDGQDDLLVLPTELARNLSNISPLVLVKGVASGIHVVDPLTGEVRPSPSSLSLLTGGQRQEVDVERYWRHSFSASMSGRDLAPFLVLSVEPLLLAQRPSSKKRGLDRKTRLAECVVVRESDLGTNDRQLMTVTHLGHILKEGDRVMG